MLVYVAHPYGGHEENKEKVEGLIKNLVLKSPHHTYVSPIHTFGFMYNTVKTYEQGMKMCTDLLAKCDVLILCDDWRNSEGCNREKDFAEEKGIPIYSYIEAVKNGNFKSKN